jgi:hypothetical protein
MSRWSRNAAATVVFIHGFCDTAALRNGLIVRLCALPWHLRAVKPAPRRLRRPASRSSTAIATKSSSSPAQLIRDVVTTRFADLRTACVARAGHWPHAEQLAPVTQILTQLQTMAARPNAATGKHPLRTEKIRK